jgi:hypothetical protein
MIRITHLEYSERKEDHIVSDYQLLAEHIAAQHRLQSWRGKAGTVTVAVSALNVSRRELRPSVTSLLTREFIGPDNNIRMSVVERLGADEWTFDLTQQFPRVRTTNLIGGDLSYDKLRREPASILSALIWSLNRAWAQAGFNNVRPPEPAFTLRISA